jgi:hypothetical protein
VVIFSTSSKSWVASFPEGPITVTAGRLPVRYHVSPNSLLVGTVTSESRPSSLQVPVTDRLTPRRLTLSLPLCTSYCDTGTYYVLLLMTYDIMSINYWKRTFPTTSSRLLSYFVRRLYVPVCSSRSTLKIPQDTPSAVLDSGC